MSVPVALLACFRLDPKDLSLKTVHSSRQNHNSPDEQLILEPEVYLSIRGNVKSRSSHKRQFTVFDRVAAVIKRMKFDRTSKTVKAIAVGGPATSFAATMTSPQYSPLQFRGHRIARQYMTIISTD